MKILLAPLLFVTYAALFVAGANSHLGDHHRRHHAIQNRSPTNTTTDHLERRADNAKFSWYDTEESGNPGSCGRHIKNSEFIVAMNRHDYKYSDCFKTITITYEGRSTQATVGDMCPICPPGGLDLSKGLFKHVAPRGDGIVYGSWVWGNSSPKPPKPSTTTTATTTTRRRTTTTPARSSTTSTPSPTSSSTSTLVTSASVTSLSSDLSVTPTPIPILVGAKMIPGNLVAFQNSFVILGSMIVEAAAANQ